MTGHEHLLFADVGLQKASGLPLAKCVSSFARRATDWFAVAADYYTAARLYGQLSKLSDAELQRRGLSRASLASDIARACDRATV